MLNEVDFNSSWSHGVDQAAVLFELLDMNYLLRQRNYDTGLPFFSMEFGNAILSRFPLKDAEFVSYPAVRWWEPIFVGQKDGVKVTVILGDDEVEVAAVHLDTRSVEIRQKSMKRLLAETKAHGVLAGDFNSVLSADGETAVDLLREDGRWQAAGGWEREEDFLSYPVGNLSRRIDWVFVPVSWNQIGVKVIEAPFSDHALVVSEWQR